MSALVQIAPIRTARLVVPDGRRPDPRGSLLLIRVVENTTGDTWRTIRHELDRVHQVTRATPDGTLAQRTAITAWQKTIMAALGVPEPPHPRHQPKRPMTGSAVLETHAPRTRGRTLHGRSTPLTAPACVLAAQQPKRRTPRAHDLRKSGQEGAAFDA